MSWEAVRWTPGTCYLRQAWHLQLCYYWGFAPSFGGTNHAVRILADDKAAPAHRRSYNLESKL